MKIEQLKLINTLDRSVFVIESKKKTANVILAVSNRQLIWQWIRQQSGTPYLDSEKPVHLTTYNKLARALIASNEVNIFFVTVAPFAQKNYSIYKLPLMRRI